MCFSVPDLDAEIMSMALDDRGFRIAVGLELLGRGRRGVVGPRAHGRRLDGRASAIGVGPDTTEDDAERLLATLPSLVSELREVRSAADAAMARFRSADDR